jgi:hypothetical protein
VSCCAWSDTYQFIFIKTAKSAGSSILLGALRSTLCPVEQNVTTHAATDFTNTLRFDANCTALTLAPTGLLYAVPDGSRVSGDDCLPCMAIEAWKWEQYFVFGATRNPWERVVSAYDYCGVKTLGLPFKFFCSNVDLAHACPAAVGIPKRDAHWAPQAPAFFWRGFSRVNFLLDVHNLARSLRHLQAQLRRRSGVPAMPQLNLTSINRRHSDNTTFLEWFTGDSSHCICTVAQQYREDVRLFGSLGRHGRQWMHQFRQRCAGNLE